MSKIQSVNYQNYPNFKQSNKDFVSGTSFGAAAPLTKAQEFIIDKNLTNTYLGSKGKFLNLLSSTAGEIQNLWIMNIGTACVAPIFIANNPISKEDKDTKKYAAWRQPISAVIALAFGLGVNIPLPAYIDKKVAEGKFEKFDLHAQPPSDYLKSRYSSIKRHFNNLKGDDKKYFDMVDDGSIKNTQDFVTKFQNNKKFEEAVHNVTLKNEAKELLNVNNPKSLRNITLREFLIKNLKFEQDYVDKAILNPEATEKLLSKIKAMDFLREFGYSADDVDEKTLRTFINNNIYNKKIRFNANEKKYITRATEMMTTEELKNQEKISLRNLFKVLDIEDDFHKRHDILDKKMDEFLLWLDKNMNIKSAVESAKSNKALEKTVEKLPAERLEQFAKQIAKNAASKAAKNYGAYKKIQGITLSLITLPFSCGLLNWAYPRIMEKCFPNLSKKPKEKADSKGGK